MIIFGGVRVDDSGMGGAFTADLAEDAHAVPESPMQTLQHFARSTIFPVTGTPSGCRIYLAGKCLELTLFRVFDTLFGHQSGGEIRMLSEFPAGVFEDIRRGASWNDF